eukprot:688533-Rhodomonas_salina.1
MAQVPCLDTPHSASVLALERETPRQQHVAKRAQKSEEERGTRNHVNFLSSSSSPVDGMVPQSLCCNRRSEEEECRGTAAAGRTEAITPDATPDQSASARHNCLSQREGIARNKPGCRRRCADTLRCRSCCGRIYRTPRSGTSRWLASPHTCSLLALRPQALSNA